MHIILALVKRLKVKIKCVLVLICISLNELKSIIFFKTAHPTVPADIWCQVWCNLDGLGKYNIITTKTLSIK